MHTAHGSTVCETQHALPGVRCRKTLPPLEPCQRHRQSQLVCSVLCSYQQPLILRTDYRAINLESLAERSPMSTWLRSAPSDYTKQKDMNLFEMGFSLQYGEEGCLPLCSGLELWREAADSRSFIIRTCIFHCQKMGQAIVGYLFPLSNAQISFAGLLWILRGSSDTHVASIRPITFQAAAFPRRMERLNHARPNPHNYHAPISLKEKG